MNPNDEDFKYYKECLEKVIGLDLIDDKTALGITKKVIAEGDENLSQKQNYVFDTNVKNIFFMRTCSKCGEEIPWCEMPYVIEDEEKICGSCLHDSEKDD